MKSTILNLIFAFLLGCSTPYIIFYASGKHQQAKESNLVIQDEYVIIDSYPDPNDVKLKYYIGENKKKRTIVFNTDDTFVINYDQIFTAKKKFKK